MCLLEVAERAWLWDPDTSDGCADIPGIVFERVLRAFAPVLLRLRMCVSSDNVLPGVADDVETRGCEGSAA